jgi:hypothetical protein
MTKLKSRESNMRLMRPDTLEYMDIFEKNTGIKCISAKQMCGSMKRYVNFTVPIEAVKDYSVENRNQFYLGTIQIKYVSISTHWKRAWLDVEKTKLKL